MINLVASEHTKDFFKTSFGNILEWYDFAIYGLFAVQISKTFFPGNNPSVGVILTFLTFASGFIARPLGSAIFGYLGDKFGKHYAVNLSVWCMAIPTSLIGLLPGYAILGHFAPFLLLFFRILQGISVGGQFSGLIAIAVDNDKQKSFYCSLVYMICMIGSLIAAIVGYLMVWIIGLLHSDSVIVNSLIWRVPFLLSGALFYIYIKMLPQYPKVKDNLENFSFIEIFKSQSKEMFLCVSMAVTTGFLYYIVFTYLVTYMQLHLHLSKSFSLMAENIMIIFTIILFPFFGKYADKQKCRLDTVKKYMYGLVASAILLFFGSFSGVVLAFSIFIALICFVAMSALTISLFAEVFNRKYRMTACSLSFNIGFVFAGFAPLVAELSTHIPFGFQTLVLSVNLLLFWVLMKLISTEGYKLYAKT